MKTYPFPKFPPTISGKYLFIFYVILRRITYPSDESLGVYLTNPKKEWFSPIMGLSMFV
jgi:hypothetical protein